MISDKQILKFIGALALCALILFAAGKAPPAIYFHIATYRDVPFDLILTVLGTCYASLFILMKVTCLLLGIKITELPNLRSDGLIPFANGDIPPPGHQQISRASMAR